MISLTACEGKREVIRTETIEVPVPVIRKIPDERLQAHEVPMLPECSDNVSTDRCIQVRQTLETLDMCYQRLHQANADKAWIRAFQKFEVTP